MSSEEKQERETFNSRLAASYKKWIDFCGPGGVVQVWKQGEGGIEVDDDLIDAMTCLSVLGVRSLQDQVTTEDVRKALEAYQGKLAGLETHIRVVREAYSSVNRYASSCELKGIGDFDGSNFYFVPNHRLRELKGFTRDEIASNVTLIQGEVIIFSEERASEGSIFYRAVHELVHILRVVNRLPYMTKEFGIDYDDFEEGIVQEATLEIVAGSEYSGYASALEYLSQRWFVRNIARMIGRRSLFTLNRVELFKTIRDSVEVLETRFFRNSYEELMVRMRACCGIYDLCKRMPLEFVLSESTDLEDEHRALVDDLKGHIQLMIERYGFTDPMGDLNHFVVFDRYGIFR